MFAFKRLCLVLLFCLVCIQGCFDNELVNNILPDIEDTQEIPDDMVLIPAGEFTMGDNLIKNAPEHEVYINAFYMDKYEVSVKEYKGFCDDTGREYPTAVKRSLFHPNHKSFYDSSWPIIGISYDDAKAYAEYVGKRLPTEAEWEYAARGGLERMPYEWGTEPPYNYNTGKQMSNFNWMSRTGNTSQGRMVPAKSDWGDNINGYGLQHMSGNASEMCIDYYRHDAYNLHQYENPTISEPGPDFKLPHWHVIYNGEKTTVVRGASANTKYGTDHNNNFHDGILVARRGFFDSDPWTAWDIGIRLVKDIE